MAPSHSLISRHNEFNNDAWQKENVVELYIQFNGSEIKIPVNPEKLTISRSASNDDIEILGIGKATKKGEPGLLRTSIESFFPAKNSYFYEYTKTYNNSEGTTPREYIDFINNIWHTENKNNNVPRLMTVGLEKSFDGMPFVIENFDYEYVAGDFDVQYKLDIKEYRNYGVKLIQDSSTGMATSRTQSPSIDDSTIQYTYTVQSGDCLWNITKACCGDGSKWKELYNINADVVGNNPNSIKVGQVLTLPTGWQTPTKVDKLKPVNKSNPIKNVADPITNEQKTAASTLAKGLSEGNVMTYAQASVKNAVIDDSLIHSTGDISTIFYNVNNTIGNNIEVTPTEKLGFWQRYKKAAKNNDITVLIYNN